MLVPLQAALVVEALILLVRDRVLVVCKVYSYLLASWLAQPELASRCLVNRLYSIYMSRALVRPRQIHAHVAHGHLARVWKREHTRVVGTTLGALVGSADGVKVGRLLAKGDGADVGGAVDDGAEVGAAVRDAKRERMAQAVSLNFSSLLKGENRKLDTRPPTHRCTTGTCSQARARAGTRAHAHISPSLTQVLTPGGGA